MKRNLFRSKFAVHRRIVAVILGLFGITFAYFSLDSYDPTTRRMNDVPPAEIVAFAEEFRDLTNTYSVESAPAQFERAEHLAFPHAEVGRFSATLETEARAIKETKRSKEISVKHNTPDLLICQDTNAAIVRMEFTEQKFIGGKPLVPSDVDYRIRITVRKGTAELVVNQVQYLEPGSRPVADSTQCNPLTSDRGFIDESEPEEKMAWNDRIAYTYLRARVAVAQFFAERRAQRQLEEFKASLKKLDDEMEP